MNYRQRHKPVSSQLTIDEYEKLKEIADAEGIAPTTYATRIVRAELAKKEAEKVE